MSSNDNKPQPSDHVLLINGQPATESQAKRLLNASARTSNPTDLATKPLHTVMRPFSILRKEIGR